MVFAERANLVWVQSALQSILIGYRVAVRKVGRAHYYNLVPHRLTHIRHFGSRCAMSGHVLMSFQVYCERMLAQPVQLDGFVHQNVSIPRVI